MPVTQVKSPVTPLAELVPSMPKPSAAFVSWSEPIVDFFDRVREIRALDRLPYHDSRVVEAERDFGARIPNPKDRAHLILQREVENAARGRFGALNKEFRIEVGFDHDLPPGDQGYSFPDSREVLEKARAVGNALNIHTPGTLLPLFIVAIEKELRESLKPYSAGAQIRKEIEERLDGGMKALFFFAADAAFSRAFGGLSTQAPGAVGSLV